MKYTLILAPDPAKAPAPSSRRQNAAPHSDGREIHGKDGVADQISRGTSGITRGDR